MRAKEEYIIFCSNNNDVPIFCRKEWLDIWDKNWDVVLSKDGNGNIQAYLPFTLVSKYGIKTISQPRLTPYLGVNYVYPEDDLKNHSKYTFEKKQALELIQQLPPFHRFIQRFQPEFDNWLPFYWKGYKQHVDYSFVLILDNIESINSKYSSKVRQKIKKAEKDYKVEIQSDIQEFVDFVNQFQWKYRFNQITQILNCDPRSFMMTVKSNNSNKITAAGLFLRDRDTYFNLIQRSLPEHNKNGIVQLLLANSIEKSLELRAKYYNFEGSMIPSIEPVYRGFGGDLLPAFTLRKSNGIGKLISWIGR